MAENSETFVNIHLHPRAYYDENPPSTAEDEKQPILSEQGVGKPYTVEINPTNQSEEPESSTNENEESKNLTNEAEARLDIPYRKPRYPLSHLFSATVCLIEVLGVILFIFLLAWLLNYHGGFEWDGASKEFNYHALFMFLGFVFFYSNAAVSSYSMNQKQVTSIHYFHVVSVLLTLFFTFFGFIVGLQVDKRFYSFHTWIGMVTLVLFFIQALYGLCCIFIKIPERLRQFARKFEIWLFLCVFLCAILATILGISEYINNRPGHDGSTFSFESIVTNVISLLLVVFSLLVTSVLMHPIYQKERLDR
ncbi:plasma membrane ascorbate-dependent reductase CYBRD1-like [Clytia hemisphaerica]|uniref:Cytochrome b561 domain-containing protein n=1 Tax=Clytia hemisphaerica TaxID=252671 RepID=A0A7M5V7X9_9CNID|eukprot:TCONS_00016586-protein